MKQVTIKNVAIRIAELEWINGLGELSMRGEFELACLRELLASKDGEPVAYMVGTQLLENMTQAIAYKADTVLEIIPLYRHSQPAQTGVDDDVRNVVAMLGNNEWAEHCTETVLGSRLESEITRLHNWRAAQPVPVVVVPTIWKHYGGGKVAHLYEQAMDAAGVQWRSVDDEPKATSDNTAQQLEDGRHDNH